jgi:hypothetical protein
MSEDAGWGTDEVRTASLLSREADDKGGRVRQGDARLDGRPPGERWPLQAEGTKEREDAPEEAFDARSFAQLLGGPSRWEAGPVLLPLGVPGDDRHGAQCRVDPRDQA